MGLVREFKDFLKEYKILPLAIAFMMGVAITALVTSLVNDIIMPFVNPLMAGDWKEATFMVGPVEVRWGSFASNLLNFAIIALVVFLIAKTLLKEEKVSKK